MSVLPRRRWRDDRLANVWRRRSVRVARRRLDIAVVVVAASAGTPLMAVAMNGERQRRDADAGDAGPERPPRMPPSVMTPVLVGMHRVANGGLDLLLEGALPRLPFGAFVAHVRVPKALAFAAPFPAREFRLLFAATRAALAGC